MLRSAPSRRSFRRDNPPARRRGLRAKRRAHSGPQGDGPLRGRGRRRGGGGRRGTLRGRRAFWIPDPTHPLAILTGTAAILAYVRFFGLPEGSLLVADAPGLALFTVIGAQTAEHYGAAPIVAMGVMTGVVGGAMRGVPCAEFPLGLREEIYATASIAGADVFVSLTRLEVPAAFAVPAPVALNFALRLAAIRYDVSAPSVIFDDRPAPGEKRA